ncbi:lipid II:glycine glycyltransferase FemX [Deinococcus lacus]|uniref:Lipid II:glycine glycyltransferase FemX n=1 Tax=Deinococcus lacus TaxID=392561 RepID=A0ABW1YCK7_9DEIO
MLELVPTHDPQTFNDVVASMPISSPLQGWGYGEARRVLGQRPERYLIRRGNQTVGAVQLIRKRLVPGFATLYAPRGPALESLDLLADAAQAIQRVARPTDTILKLEPPLAIAATEDAEIPSQYGPLHRAAAEQPEHTILADLTRSEEEMFAAMHSMARRNVRAAQKMGVEAGRDPDFEGFWEIFTATNERAKLGAFPRAYYETMLREGNKWGRSLPGLVAPRGPGTGRWVLSGPGRHDLLPVRRQYPR